MDLKYPPRRLDEIDDILTFGVYIIGLVHPTDDLN